MLNRVSSGFATLTQVDFLTQWGIYDLVREGIECWESMKHAPNVAAMKMRSRLTEAKLLKHPSVWVLLIA